MGIFRYYTVLFSLFFTFHLCCAENNLAIDPSSLRPQWWDAFIKEPGSTSAKGQALVGHIETIIPSMSEGKKEEAEEIVDRISLNFTSYEKAKNATPIAIPPITPSASSYPIDEAIDIARKIQSENVVIRNLKDEKIDRQSQIAAAQEELDRLAKNYFRLSEPTEERFILGLKLIEYHVAILTAKEEIKRIENGIIGYEAYVKRLSEELDISEKNLVAKPEELAKVQEAQKSALLEWQATRSILRQLDVDQITRSSDYVTDSTSPTRRLLDQQMTEANIQEMIAHENYLSLEIKGALLSLLLDPESVDLAEFSEKAKEWAQTLSEMTQKMNKYLSTVQRELQRTGQLISLAAPGESEFTDDKTAQEEIINLAQKNLQSLQKLKSEIQDSNFLISRLDSRLTKEIGGSVRLGQLLITYLKSFWVTVGEWVETPFFYIGSKPIHLSSILKFLAILLLTFWGSDKVVQGLNQWAVTKRRIEKSLLYRISRLIYYLLLTIGFIIALSSIGFDFSSFLLIAGALGVGLGFGLQTIFNNFMSGLILLFESQIKVGDFVEIASGVRGEVKEINVRSTIITMADGLDVIVPNSEMVSTRVVNWTLIHPYRRLKIPFTVAYGSDKDLVRKVISEAAAKMPQTLVKPGFSDPNVVMSEFAASGINFFLFVWVNEKYSKLPLRASSDYLWMVDDVLKEHEIEIPYDKLDLRIV